MSRHKHIGFVLAIGVVLGLVAVGGAAEATPAPPATAPPATAPPATATKTTPTKPTVVGADRWAALHRVAPVALTPRQVVAQSASRAPRVDHLAPTLYAAAGVSGASEAVDGRTPIRSDGLVEVTVSGAQAGPALRAVGGRTLASYAATVTALVRPAKLRALAGSPGVQLVAPISRAYTENGPAQSVNTSLASVWQTNGRTGAGAVVAIVDGGFAGLAGEVGAGHLPMANRTVNGNHCADVDDDDHGTAVAEIVHQMAPDATLLLYCIDDTVGLAQAAVELKAAGAQIVSCSLGFVTDARGDGTGLATTSHTSAAVTVAGVRKQGVLWVNSAGNSAADHWSGALTDRNDDGWVDLNTVSDEFDQIVVPAGSSTEVALSWDQWPASTLGVNLRLDISDATTGNSVAYGVGSALSGLSTAPVR
ncbi:MAG: hypothetical protein JWM76_4158, partial [Pseudonocardiales bacterium]|nr:hypothetical protein [Pseudonocardiales bacterium]